jgi:hypothetical protein
MPAEFAFGTDWIVPLKAGEAIRWRIAAAAEKRVL